MSNYIYPYRDVEFVINELTDFDQFCVDANLGDINSELASVILTEAGKFGSEVIAPLNVIGDSEGATLTENGVVQSSGFAEAYQQFSDNGWQSLTAAEEFGGQALPNILGTAISEIWQTACLSFSLCPMLTHGAISAISHHGSEDLKQTWLPNMVSGNWTGTMNLTEPGAGTDLASIRTKAVPDQEHYKITGQKIFITWGDHQMSENIVHLVLARLPDAPAGVKGISLFIVPKFLLDENGKTTAERNDVACTSLEHKLGIHGSPTCVMSFGDNGGAEAYLVGEKHQGLICMFTMMNHARQDVGLEGLAVSERSYQQALAYAKERIQGTDKQGKGVAIIQYPDVRRMLMQMKSAIEAMRALAYVTSVENDLLKSAKDQTMATKHQTRIELLTPIVKGWLTELAQEITYLGIQIHGGMGFIEETGAAQHYRDARILTIYEGTTGIQGLDLVGRKTLLNKGVNLEDLLDEIELTCNELEAANQSESMVMNLKQAVATGRQARQWLLTNAEQDANAAASVSVNFLMLFGYLCGGWMMARAAIKAQALLDKSEGDAEFLNAKLTTSRYYCEHLLPRVYSYLAIIQSGSSSVMALSEEQF